jgi:hypothetical protein
MFEKTFKALIEFPNKLRREITVQAQTERKAAMQILFDYGYVNIVHIVPVS